MATPAQLMAYLEECYRADNRELTIFNLYSKKVENLYFLPDSEQLLADRLDKMALDPAMAKPAHQAALLYKKDKSLVYAAFMIAGRLEKHPRLPKRICSPLLFYPATISQGEEYFYLHVDFTRRRINFPLLSALLDVDESDNDRLDDLVAQIPEPPFRTAEIYSFASALKDFLPQLNIEELYHYPRLSKESKIKRKLHPLAGEGLTCFPATAMALLRNSVNTRGVLSELHKMVEMSEKGELSAPLRCLLEKETSIELSADSVKTHVPVILSASQQKILQAGASYPLTLAVGPPGTGKSYTIAALALDHVSRGETVLIASRMNHAVDVVGDKIEDILGQKSYAIRGGRKEYMRELKGFLKQILSALFEIDDEEFAEEKLQCLRNKLENLNNTIADFETRFDKLSDWEESWGKLQEPAELGIFSDLIRRFQLYCLDKKITGSLPQWQLMELYQQALQDRVIYQKEILQYQIRLQIQKTLEKHRRDLVKFRRSISVRSNLKQEKLFGEIDRDILLKTFPVWMVNLADINEILPLIPELFDVAIIDEATQCDIASCMPVLMRARRVVITGDPQQLRHISFLSHERRDRIATRYELNEDQSYSFDYREKSFLDLVQESITSQKQVHFLDEHYRSMPQIIAFSNRHFYHDRLKIMTQRPDTTIQQCLYLKQISGERNKDGFNDQEAQALVDDVCSWVAKEAYLPKNHCHSLGILSPFRSQVEHIFRLLSEKLPLHAFDRHELMVGTAHTFQGEERDIMFLSLALDAKSHFQAFRFLCKNDVFNVSITRARHKQYVYCSVPQSVPYGELLRHYLEFIQQPLQNTDDSRLYHDRFLNEVSKALQEKGFTTWSAYPVAGFTIDLMVEKEGRAMGIDLIGYPGHFVEAIHLERYRIFQRAGLKLFPLPYSLWQKDEELCLKAILEWQSS